MSVEALAPPRLAATRLRTVLRALGWCGLAVVGVAVALSDFLAQQPAGRQGAGAVLVPPSPQFVFGTDLLGRDVLSETLHGLDVTVENALLATGISPSTLFRRDLIYEFRNNFLETAARALAAVAITLSTASFLGFAAVPPHRDLGLMIAASRASYLTAWWTAAFPALALLLLILFARLAAGLDEGERP